MKKTRFLTAAVIASQFAPPFMFSGVGVTLPKMGMELNAGATALGLVETLFITAQLAFMLPIGRFADAGEKRSLYKIGLVGFAGVSLIISQLRSMPLILLMRFLQGIFSAMFSATAPAILTEIVPPERRGRAFGASIGTTYAGLTLGPLCAGLLVDYWNWRAVYIAGGIIILCGYLLVSRLMTSKWRWPAPGSIHIPSALLISSSILCLVGGGSLIKQGSIGYVLIAASLLLGLGFILLQRRLSQPLLDVRTIGANHILRNALLVQLLLYMNAACSGFLLNLYMQISLGYSANVAGKVIAAGAVLMAIVPHFSGRLADRYRPEIIAALGVSSLCISTLLGSFVTSRTSLFYIVLILSTQGLGFALFSSPNTKIIMSNIPATKTGMAGAIASKMRSLGMVSGMLITTILIAELIGNHPLPQYPEALMRIVHLSYLIQTGFTFLAFGLTLSGRKRAQPYDGR